jgi:acetyl-CoA synthetase
MSEKDVQLEARLEEQDTFEPSEEFVEQANVSDAGIYDEFEENWPGCWERAAELLDWYEGYDEVLNDEDAPFYEWFVDGRLNASYNCVDRHLDERADEVAIEWVGEPVDEKRTYTYEELHEEVNEFAAALRDIGVEEDDVVTMYMPMIPELPIAMLACARIGAPHSVVFAGFSADALATRMESADSEFLVTCDGYYRRGNAFNQKSQADNAVLRLDNEITTVVVDRLGDELDHVLGEGQYGYDDLIRANAGATVEPVEREAGEALFLMYTSGTTGEPKGVVHGTGGYLSHTAWTSKAVLDIKPDDTYWCSADIGWITGHSYIVYGPLALGATTVMYEGTPDYPDRSRVWEIIERNSVDIFYTAPTAIRAFMKWGSEYPEAHDLSSLRLLGTVGEPINPRAWKWYYKNIGNENCPVVDTWWQTETGGMMVTTLPGVGDMKPGNAGPAVPGVSVEVVDDAGEAVGSGEAGYLTVDKPWPGMLRTLHDGDGRYVDEYWRGFSRPDDDKWVYFSGDEARVDDDGYITVLGRVDDVINVSGHRLGTMEVESAIVGVEGIAEAAVVGSDGTETSIYAYAITEDGYDADASLRDEVATAVESGIGGFAQPEEVVFTTQLPKTRSGKIMRRLLEDIANHEPLGDTSALRNPEVVGEIEAIDGEEE